MDLTTILSKTTWSEILSLTTINKKLFSSNSFLQELVLKQSAMNIPFMDYDISTISSRFNRIVGMIYLLEKWNMSTTIKLVK